MEPWEDFQLADIEGEVWRDVAAYDGLYQVSNLGRVKSLERWVERRTGGYWASPRIRKPGKAKHGGASDQFSYYVPLTGLDSVTTNHTLARVVVDAFGPVMGDGESVHHINGKSHDNRWCNLTCENISVKRKIEYDLGMRERTRAAARNLPQVARLVERQLGAKGMPSHVTKAAKAKTFRQRNSMVVTVTIPARKFVSVFTSIRSAAKSLGIKEYSLRNALNKPHKYKRFSVTLGAHHQDAAQNPFCAV